MSLALRVYSLASLPLGALCFMFVREDVVSWFPALATQAAMPFLPLWTLPLEL